MEISQSAAETQQALQSYWKYPFKNNELEATVDFKLDPSTGLSAAKP